MLKSSEIFLHIDWIESRYFTLLYSIDLTYFLFLFSGKNCTIEAIEVTILSNIISIPVLYIDLMIFHDSFIGGELKGKFFPL
ncbi:MAG: hypothetical protein KAW56_03175 [Candidatus Marinimicrobia bacterium]|nr:hypothetical protein [Candidatus Neomarinimicrobiota bacterium]